MFELGPVLAELEWHIEIWFIWSLISQWFHTLWCITEWNSSSWNSLFCFFLNFRVKHIHVFSLEQQILEQSIRKKICILHVLTPLSVVGVSFVPPSTVFTSFSFSGNTLGLEEFFLLFTSAPISLWTDSVWNLRKTLWEIRQVGMTRRLPWMWVL